MLDLDMSVMLLAATAITLFVLWKRSTRKSYRLPPGPKGAFLVGHAFRPWMNVDYLDEIGKPFGDIFTLPILGQPVVVVSSNESIKEAYGKDCLAGRSQSAFIRHFTGGNGVLWTHGERWRIHRRFALSILKDFGLGKTKIEDTIQFELQQLRSALQEANGKPFFPLNAYAKAVSNVINSIVFNERWIDDAEFERVIGYVHDISQIKPQATLFSFLWPVLKRIPWDVTGLKKVDAARVGIHKYVAKNIQQHRETFDASNIRDYIDAFLLESQQKEGTQYFTGEQLQQTVFDLFMAGVESTTTNLLWCSVLLAQHVDIQQKLFEEIDRTIGLSKLPSTSDRSKMPYLDAFLHELLRYCSIAPLGIAHAALSDTQVCGYDIPTDCVVISNLWSVNHSSKLWKDPNNFNPENFLDDEGKLVNTHNMLSFGAGRRVCLGEALARQEMFIFVTGLLQHFEFVQDRDHRLPSMDQVDKMKVSIEPGHFKVVLKVR